MIVVNRIARKLFGSLVVLGQFLTSPPPLFLHYFKNPLPSLSNLLRKTTPTPYARITDATHTKGTSNLGKRIKTDANDTSILRVYVEDRERERERDARR